MSSGYDTEQTVLRKRLRTTILSLILLSIYVQNLHFFSLVNAVWFGLIGMAYLAFLWLQGSLLNTMRKRIAAVGLLWMLTSWIAIWSGEYQASYSLLFYLLGYIALRFPGRISFIMAAAVIVLDGAVLFFFIKQVPVHDILLYSAIHSSAFVFIWAIRVRREAKESSRKHFEELQQMHSQLEQTHRELQIAHQELEEATALSLRYAVLEERTRIARDLHDSIGHGLTSVIVQLQALPFMIKMNEEKTNQTISTVLEVARQCLTEVRLVVHKMAEEDEDTGLVALKSLIKRVQDQSGLSISFRSLGVMSNWKPEMTEMLYRVLQEALTNVIRHAQATQVAVTVDERARELTMTVKDNGIFNDDTEYEPGFGLAGMKARCEREGGSCTVQACHPHGMMIIVTVPKDKDTDGER